jgi:RNA polymerase sigma-70 factor (ECF subfamily)
LAKTSAAETSNEAAAPRSTRTPAEDAAFRDELVSLIPHLRAFARSICRDSALADDLAQDAMLKAWRSRDSFETGTNMKAWAFTILRNLFYSEKRRSWRSQHLDPEVAESTLVANDNPSSQMDLLALRNALDLLPDEQKEALILVGAGGMSYEEAAAVCGCAVGTVKSRVSRARAALVDKLSGDAVSYVSGNDPLRAADAFDDLMGQVETISRRAR